MQEFKKEGREGGGGGGGILIPLTMGQPLVALIFVVV